MVRDREREPACAGLASGYAAFRWWQLTKRGREVATGVRRGLRDRVQSEAA